MINILLNRLADFLDWIGKYWFDIRNFLFGLFWTVTVFYALAYFGLLFAQYTVPIAAVQYKAMWAIFLFILAENWLLHVSSELPK